MPVCSLTSKAFVPVLSRENPLTFHIKKATIFGDYLEIGQYVLGL